MEKDIKRTLRLGSREETREFALTVSERLKGGGTLALIGDLGTGKTTITKYIAEGLGIKKRITSPTFTIVNEYHEGVALYHFDAYRLEGADRAFDLGVEEYFYEEGAVCIVEWADIILDLLPEDTLFIYLDYGEDENERIARCTF